MPNQRWPLAESEDDSVERGVDLSFPFALISVNVANKHQECGCPTRHQPEPYQGGNRGPKRITGDAVPRRDKDGGLTRPERVVVF